MAEVSKAGQLRYRIGLGFVILSLVCPLIALAISLLGLPKSATAFWVGAFLVGLPEVFICIGAALAGKRAVAAITGKVKALLRRKGPPKPVGRLRYNIGLTLLIITAGGGWAAYYVDLALGLNLSFQAKLIAGIVVDSIMFASLFVLGGEFWEKFKSLFYWSVPGPEIPPAARPTTVSDQPPSS